MEIAARAHLDKSNPCRLLAEALTTKVKSVLADETVLMCAQAAEESPKTQLVEKGGEPGKFHVPLAGPRTKLAGAREPDGRVRHFEEFLRVTRF